MAQELPDLNPTPGAAAAAEKVDADPDVVRAILARCAVAGAGKSVDPTEIARALGGSPAEVVPWRALIRRIRAAAALLQDDGQIVVLRKGKPVDIRAAKGVIRLGLAGSD
jgi:hypothetical protein